jgi:hypothetical protein
MIKRGIELFNKLPNNIKNMEHFPTFRKELRSFLLSNVFYTINEFDCFKNEPVV